MKTDVVFSCGHSGVVELSGSSKDRESKMWYYQNRGLCPECYKKYKQEQNEKEGLVLNIGLNPNPHGEKPIILFFTGNSFPDKDKIKQLGGYYYDYVDHGLLGSLFGGNIKAWQTRCEIAQLDEKIEKAKTLNPKVVWQVSEMDLAAFNLSVKRIKERNA